ncbi:histidine triad nucleotide-binding protein [Chitinilyticum piscinae]|uniref:Histidine triad nucleotide-binding protein n=1 Tax=Chitinilyticum piscinae TaxID=2866724 RepID=A0A8J7FJT0_9NEIS|nr:histidine triad nucleotide-binding protein [Chitinilyticum piscinae]MBE9609182.1 histidine triad nucleotide-binding protein [Chitinilyticum piscinae]
MSDCIFCKIAAGQIPAKKAYEDDDVVVFHDIAPKAPVHLLLIPKKHIESLFAATVEDQAILGKLLLLAPQLAKEHGLDAGFVTRIHTGAAGGQEVFHLHVHVLGQPQAAA